MRQVQRWRGALCAKPHFCGGDEEDVGEGFGAAQVTEAHQSSTRVVPSGNFNDYLCTCPASTILSQEYPTMPDMANVSPMSLRLV